MKQQYFTIWFSILYCSQVQTDQLEVDAALEQVQEALKKTRQTTVIDLMQNDESKCYNYATTEGPKTDRCLDVEDEGFMVSIDLVYDACYSVKAKSREQAISLIKANYLKEILHMVDEDSKTIGDKYGLNFGPGYCDIA